MAESRPSLWQIDVSHYSEKARWALDLKGVDYRRRSPPPGAHIPVALFLTRGRHATFPILRIDGRTIGDSTAIIAALEQLHPDPALYPADPALRRRALELEELFDEEIGPAARLLAFHEIARDQAAFEALMRETAPPPTDRVPAVTVAYAKAYTAMRFGARDEKGAAAAREKLAAGFDRIEAELGDREYLVGDRFSVADLTAASLFNPVVLPDQGPVPNAVPVPRGMAEFRAPHEGRRAYAWVEEMFARHRTAAAPMPAAQPAPQS
jgi:glutathione S-transferase